MLGDDNPNVHLVSTTHWSEDFHEQMCIHNDGRSYGMLVRNDGEIVWASHDKFKEHLQTDHMVRTVNRECEYRIYEQERVLGARKTAGVIVAPDSPDAESA